MRIQMLLPALVLMLPAIAFAREWTDATGRHHREEQYVGHDERQVWVRTDAGKLCVARGIN